MHVSSLTARLDEAAALSSSMALERLHELLVDGATTRALLLLLVPLALVLLITRRLATPRRCSSGGKPPPSPPYGLPVIGHVHLVGSQPHISLRDLAEAHGDDGLVLLRLGAVPTLVASSPRAAEAVLRTHDHALASRARSPVADIIFYGSSDVAFAPYGDYWRQAKKVVTTHMLSARKVNSYRHGRHEEARQVIAKIRDAAATGGGTAAVDMSELLGAYTNDVVCRAVVGKHLREHGRNKLFRELIEINVSLLGGFNLEDYFPWLATASDVLMRVVCAKAKKVRERWDNLFDELIDEHERLREQSCREQEEEESADLIHVLLGLQEEYGLTRENVKAILLDMFQAGTETSYLVLEYAMAELMRNREHMAKLKAEVTRGKEVIVDMLTEEDINNMAYLKAVVKETMRLHPPVPILLPHLSIADCEINGYLIPSGTRVIVDIWALGRDPKAWEKPEEFAPERFLEGGSASAIDMKGKDFELLPFGAGRRICPGINFGMASIEIMLANLVYHFDWEVPMERTGRQEIDMTEVFGLSLRRKEKLLLVPSY